MPLLFLKKISIHLACCLCILAMFSQPTQANTIKLLIFGDSLSTGYGANPKVAWPVLLQQKLNLENIKATVINASVNGETTYGGLKRFQDTLQRHHPTFVVLELGTNDALQGLSLIDMQQNLQAMIDVCRKENVQILLVGNRLPSIWGKHNRATFSHIYNSLAQTNTIPLVPSLLKGTIGNTEYMQVDLLHPNAKGQTLLLNNVWPSIKKLLTESD